MMTTMATPDVTEKRSCTVRAGWNRARSILEARRAQVQQEITRYPMPIPACDAHFNLLLEERGRISEELARLPADDAPGNAVVALEAFVKVSRCLDADARRQILAAVTTGA